MLKLVKNEELHIKFSVFSSDNDQAAFVNLAWTNFSWFFLGTMFDENVKLKRQFSIH